jgi:hypothetical protein
MAKLFGFSIEDEGKESPSILSPVPPNNEDSSDFYLSSGFFGSYVDIEGVYRTEFDLIKRYREMALHPECDSAIEDIVNEAIVSDTNDTPIQIDLDNLNASDGIKKKIRQEFKYILELLDFDKKSHEIYRNWYVDGRLYYHKVIDLKNPEAGIQELRYIDAMKMRYVRQQKKSENDKKINRLGRMNVDDPMEYEFPEIEEYFVYNPKMSYPTTNPSSLGGTSGIKFTKDSITYCTSGLVDRNKGSTLSYLHKAIKSLNQLRMIEDSLVIYRLSRAPERRIFYIDVGNLPKVKAEQYLRDVMMRYRNKLVYDSCLAMDTKIPLLDGRTLSLSEITKEFNEGNRLWAYSCDPKTGKFAPGIISWAGVTRKNEKVMRITLDNDEAITCTLDHKFPVWNKGKVEAKDLKVGDSMIPHYKRQNNIPGNKNSTYEQLYENESKKWIFTHRLVSNWKDQNNLLNEYNFNQERIDENKCTVHHKDYDRYNNSPENLIRMSRDDHFEYHKKHCSDAGKIGGKVCAQRKRELGLPFFNISKEQQIENGKIYGSKGGKNCYLKKSGIHSLSKTEIVNNSKKGNEILQDKLKTDIKFREKFKENIRNGWTEESRNSARERGKAIPKSHFQKMTQLAQNSLWGGKNSEEYRQKLSNKQTIEYTQQIFNIVEECAERRLSLNNTISFVNDNIDFTSWIELNSEKRPRKGKGLGEPLSKFTYSNLINVCRQLGFNSWKEYRNSFIYKNHKIKNIEFLDDTMDVGTLTIDKEELYHDYHTFALDCGIYTCNSTGEVRDDKKFMAMLEDFWLPRREGGRGTEISTLPGGQNLGEITDINYFQKKLYNSLNVPPSRMDGEGGFNLGKSSEILRDEVKFSKFVSRLRKRFSYMFSDMLKTQLILKNIITPEDWSMMDEHIQYDFLYDNHFAELKDAELLNERLGMVQIAEPYVGKYFSQDYVRRKILRQTDVEIVEEDAKIEKEIKKGVIPDPSIPIDPQTGMPLDQTSQMNLGKPVIEPDIESQAKDVVASGKQVEMPKGGVI